MKFKNVQQVTLSRLCTGCGICYSMCSEKNIALHDIEDDGIRPIVNQNGCRLCGRCLKACPGIKNIDFYRSLNNQQNERIFNKWGNIYELWEGYASDPEIRFRGSSGGLCTALSLFCLEQGYAGGVVHIGADQDKPWLNKTFRSETKDELISRAGSRYAPASPGNGIHLIENARDKSVFIGKPCDVAGIRMVQQLRPDLDTKISLVIGFFCAGTPSTRGTIEFLNKNGLDKSELSELRYRGNGWPGEATAILKDAKLTPFKTTYEKSWGFIQKYRAFRCYLCPDLTSQNADISVGDPWYREIKKNEPGRSLILIRTERGHHIFQKAIKLRYIIAEKTDTNYIYFSQKNLLGKKQQIWGRLLAMRLLNVPTPKIIGYNLFENWIELTLKEKAKSIFSTLKRIIKRRYFKVNYSKFKTVKNKKS